MSTVDAVVGNSDRDLADLLVPVIPTAQRLAYAMLQNEHESEDAVQEATFKAWRAFSRFREGSNFRAWFLTIVANECRQRRRNRWWSVLKLGDRTADEHHRIMGDEIDASDLRQALKRLPDQMKLALVLRYYLDLPFEDVGRVLGVNGNAAKARVHRALSRLRVDVTEMTGDE